MSLEKALAKIKNAKEKNLKALDLSDLNLKVIPKEITELPQLTNLYLNNNQLSNLSPLKSLNNLIILSIAKNKIETLPPFLLELETPIIWDQISIQQSIYFHLLGNLDLSLSLALATDQIIDAKKATSLVLDRDLYNAIDQARTLAQTLDHITIDSNALDYILDRSLDLTTDLNKAVLIDPFIHSTLQSSTPIHAINQVRDLGLDLSHATARVLARILIAGIAQDIVQDISLAQAPNINQLAKLTLLAQARAKVLEITKAPNINLKQEYSGIFLMDNPFTSPPPEIIQRGRDSLVTYLKELEVKEYLNEVKVILVGEGASGKTSLVKKLVGDRFNKKEKQTHGIRILKHNFKLENKDLIVNFWDFGGQEIMHATHQFFLTKRCLYLLLLDSRKDEKAEYWLNYIQSFGGDAPVIVVINKYDENPSFDVNRRFLSKKYPNIIAYHKVSCLNDIGITELGTQLLNTLWNLELRNTGFPRGWFYIKQQMESLEEDYINYSTYQTICEKNNVYRQDSQRVLLALLNDLGIVLNYDNLRYYDTQVLNPLWLTNAVYRIINSPILAESKGRFHINDLDEIINDQRYQKENPEHWSNIFKFWRPEQKLHTFPEEKFLFIVAIMKQFELLFQIDEHHYLIPGLLSEQENTHELNNGGTTLEFVIEFMDFLPTSIIPRLMVKLNKYIYQNKIWKTGMVLEENLLFNSMANIVLDKESKKIHISIKGKRNRDFLTVIRETIKEINSDFQDLAVTEWIPLPELYKGEILLVDYEELIGYEEGGQGSYYSGKLRKAFPIADLLNGIEQPESRQLMDGALKIFISYSQKDLEHKDRLVEHLMPLIRLNKATLWDDSNIEAGAEREAEIFENLENAHIVLCLISASFIASDFCYAQELTQVLKAHENGSKIIIPILIKECNWGNLEISQIQGVPRKWMTNINDHQSWTVVSKKIEAAIDSIKANKRYLF